MTKNVEVEQESEPEEVEEPKEEPIRISKKTGKPVRQMSEKQLEHLRNIGKIAREKKKELSLAKQYETKAEILKKAKEEKEQKLKLSKKKYEEEVETLEVPTVTKKPEKKIKKKVIKYIEASSSESEEEEVIIRKKKKDKPPPTPKPEPPVQEQVSKQNLRQKLQDQEAASLAKLMMPSYF